MKVIDGVQYIDITEFHFDWQPGADNIVVMGAHWHGKTVLGRELVAAPIVGKFPMWIWDHNGKFATLAPDSICYSVEKLVYGTQILIPAAKSPEYFEKFCRLVNAQRNMLIIVDEAHNFCSAHRLPPEFGRLIRDKGNQNVGYCCIFQAVTEVHKSIIRNAKHRFVFFFDVPTDVDYLRKWIGIESELFLSVDHLNRKYFRGKPEHPQLPKYSFIYRDQTQEKPLVVVNGLKL